MFNIGNGTVTMKHIERHYKLVAEDDVKQYVERVYGTVAAEEPLVYVGDVRYLTKEMTKQEDPLLHALTEYTARCLPCVNDVDMLARFVHQCAVKKGYTPTKRVITTQPRDILSKIVHTFNDLHIPEQIFFKNAVNATLDDITSEVDCRVPVIITLPAETGSEYAQAYLVTGYRKFILSDKRIVKILTISDNTTATRRYLDYNTLPKLMSVLY